MNLAHLLRRAGLAAPSRPAVAVGPDTRLDYGALARRTATLAGRIRARFGLSHGSRVAFAMRNGPAYVELMFAAWHAGLTAVPMNAKLHPREFEFILQDAGGLPAKLKMAVPGQEFFSVGDGGTLEAALGTLAMSPYTPRIFPLYEGVDGMGQPIIISFIAARVIAVATTTDGMGDIDSIKLTLQPTLVSDPNAVTNTAFRGHVGVPNLTIAKLRLVP